MTYRQYTECVKASSFHSSPIIESVAMGLFAGLTALVLGILASGGIGGLLGGAAAGIAIVSALMSFTHWWLYGRLICLGDDQCAIGMVLSVEPPSGKSDPFSRMDSDYSINLLLPPGLPGATQADIIASGVQGFLIAEQDATKSIGVPFRGEFANACNQETCGDSKCPKTASLHAEFEGAGMYIFYQWLKAALALFIGATIASAFCLIPVIGWIACVIAAIVIAVASAAVLAGLLHGNLDSASPSDVDPALGGELHQNDCNGTGADLVVVKGAWVFDSLHEGWNEIHPIKHCQRIGTWQGSWPFDPATEQKKWCEAIAEASSAITVEKQKEPEHQWILHPDIDGCEADKKKKNLMAALLSKQSIDTA